MHHRASMTFSWIETIKDLKFLRLTEDMVQNKSLCKSKIKAVDHR